MICNGVCARPHRRWTSHPLEPFIHTVLCIVLSTILWAGPPSLIDFHLTDNGNYLRTRTLSKRSELFELTFE